MRDWGYATITSQTGRTLTCDRCDARVRQLHGAPGESDRICGECVRDDQEVRTVGYRAQIARMRLILYYAIDRDDHPPVTRKRIVTDIFATADEALLAEDVGCVGKHWWPGYLDLGDTCHYCGWTKEPAL